MKTLRYLFLALVFFGSSSITFASDYQDHKDAADALGKGDYKTAYKLWLPLAEQGKLVAQLMLGTLYRQGNGVPQDFKEAAKWYRLAAEQGSAAAHYALGGLYFEGEGVPKDHKEAAKWLRLPAEQGDVHAQNSLALIYMNNEGVPQDFEEAAKWYRLAAEQGDESAQALLSVMYSIGRGVPVDFVLAHMWSTLSGSQGNEDAIKTRIELEKMMAQSEIEKAQEMAKNWKPKKHTSSTSAITDTELAKDFPELADSLGFQDAMEAYDRNDYEAAHKLFLPLAKRGHDGAQMLLGDLYQGGLGVPQDFEEAAKWYRLAVEQGSFFLAQFRLGELYREGRGVPQDFKEAIKWYRLAAEQGHVTSSIKLGLIYLQGKEVSKDPKEAAKWTRIAAEQGDADGQSLLGFLYFSGQGVLKDNVLAYMWWNLASSQGSEQAIESRTMVEQQMSPSQIEKAQEMARNWEPRVADLQHPQGDKRKPEVEHRRFKEERENVARPQRPVEPAAPQGMVKIPGGEFRAGLDPDVGFRECKKYPEKFGCKQESFTGEGPERMVLIDTFYMDKYEVTQAKFEQVMGKNPSGIKGANRPVGKVTWREADAYCQKVGKRLPTEAEWEKAAKGGRNTLYPWGNEFDGSKANFCDRSGSQEAYCQSSSKLSEFDDGHAYTAPVGSYAPNGYGLYDMAGNVDEWVADWHEKDYYKNASSANPKGPSWAGPFRLGYKVLRGGSWFDIPSFLRTASRTGNFPLIRASAHGFRCAQ